MELKKFAGQNKEELSMVEVAHALLEETGEVYDFTQLLVTIQEYLEISEEDLEKRMARFYTDINIDGRFISLGENRWGLRAWYPIDSIDEEIVGTIDDEDLPRRRRRKKTNKINAFGDGEDIIDYNEDDPEDIDDIYDEDYELEDDEDEEDDELEGLTEIEDEDEEDPELKDYAGDLSEFGDDEIDLESDTSFEDEDDEFFDEEEEEAEEEVRPEESEEE
ncbi:DNA-directed RNA polymerase subunit delta [Ignavigranum ruoffiae]|uniref:Probable DNA-directed RNA polymerase subunit delta n=1 Tax=Ignavigranum ruoffiae TaxID=89093 RepID=A0A1H9BHA6_9LACT|nr:DNA-directed RNA polymerase subunit delta [Ignavigranum ruoffiae]SEP88382.1 DNA-directed RNA polymerase subunit delta [Ignavigranum ruoffiae]